MTSGAATLTNAVINIGAVAEHARRELVAVLDSVHGKKGLVLDKSLSGPLSQIAEVAMLKEHGVEKIFHLEPDPLETDVKNIIYICRPKMHLMKFIANHIQAHNRENQKKEYSLFLVPRRTLICERILEEEGVYGDVTINEYPLDLIPYDEDVLSLELGDAVKECYLDGDYTSLYYVARSLMKLQAMFGIIPRVVGKGVCSHQILEMMLRMRKELGGEELPVTPEIDTVVLVDREADWVTPMCTQLTYEGLIDEIIGIENGYVESPDSQPGQPKRKVPLNSNDRLYAEIRDVNFSVLGPVLHHRARQVDQNYQERHQAQTVSQIRDFMKKLGGLQQEHQSLRVHTSLAEKIQSVTNEHSFHKRLEAEQSMIVGSDTCNDYVEDCINRQQPLTQVLRLLSLHSLTNNGMKQKHFDFFRKEVLQSYGYEHLITLHNLEKMGLLRPQEGGVSVGLATGVGRTAWSSVRKAFHLVVDDIDEENPNDVAYVFSGYAPLSVRLVHQALQPNGWHGVEDALKNIMGPHFDVRQTPAKGTEQAAAEARPVTLVVFVGGVTSAEISALRFLGQHMEGKRDFIIATTKIISGNTMMDTVLKATEQ